MWTDADREMKRPYLSFIGRKLVDRFSGNLDEAMVRHEQVCRSYKGDSNVTLYHDKRNIENMCCQQTTQG